MISSVKRRFAPDSSIHEIKKLHPVDTPRLRKSIFGIKNTTFIKAIPLTEHR